MAAAMKFDLSYESAGIRLASLARRMMKQAETGDRPEGEGPKEKVLSTGKIAVNPPAKKAHKTITEIQQLKTEDNTIARPDRND